VLAKIDNSREDINDHILSNQTDIVNKVQISIDIATDILNRIVNPNDGLFWRINQMETYLKTDIVTAETSIKYNISVSYDNLNSYLTQAKSSLENNVTTGRDTIESFLANTIDTVNTSLSLSESRLQQNLDNKFT